MKILVTGGAGFVGTNLVKSLLKKHEEIDIQVLDNFSTGFRHNMVEDDRVKYHEFDVADYFFDNHLNDTLGDWRPDTIYHLAALARIQPSFTEPKNTFAANTIGTQNILEWARQNGNIQVVYAGSSSSHGDIYANPYTFYKYNGEMLVELYSKIYDLPTAICRFYNVYGPHQLEDGAYATVIGIFEKQFRDGVELTITGDGEQRRDFTHVDDIVDGIVKCGEQIDKSNGKTFELGRGENFSINVVAQSFDVGYTYIPARPGEMRETLCTDTKARETLGWEPKIDLLDYIEERRNETN